MGRQKAKQRRAKENRTRSGEQYAAWMRHKAAEEAARHAQNTNGCECWVSCGRAKKGRCDVLPGNCELREAVLQAEERIRSGNCERYDDEPYMVRTVERRFEG